jgi:hypothetical protein
MSFSNVHRCKVFCHNIDPDQMDLLGLESKEDTGKWLPFSFRLDSINMIKMTSDDPDHPTFGCTTLFLDNSDTYIIDTPFQIFESVFINYVDDVDTGDDDDDIKEDDLLL